MSFFDDFNGKEKAGFIISIVNFCIFLSIIASVGLSKSKLPKDGVMTIILILIILGFSIFYGMLSVFTNKSDMGLHFSLIPYYVIAFCLFMLMLLNAKIK